jgi:hypothetical protein
MFISSAQAPYAGVYQRQPTGLPRAEFIPQYSDIPATNGYPPQAAYQNNGFGGEIYVPQMNGQQVCVSFCLYASMNTFLFNLELSNATNL